MQRKDIFLESVHALEENAQKRYKKSFSLLKSGDQDKILSDFEKGKFKLQVLNLLIFSHF